MKTSDLNSEERNLVSVGFKNLIGSRRSALRNIAGIEQNTKYAHFSDGLQSYKRRIQDDLYAQCKRIIDIIEKSIMDKAAENPESKAFFEKMIADYYRYIAESASDDRLDEVSDLALKYYEQARVTGNALESFNPIRLGLALNYSVFYFEVRKNKEKACEIA